MLQQLTSLKDDGGDLTGGKHKDTYDHKLKQKIKKKAQKKEDAAKAEEEKKTKKKIASLEMIQTKLTNKMEKEKAAKEEKETMEGGPAASASSTG